MTKACAHCGIVNIAAGVRCPSCGQKYEDDTRRVIFYDRDALPITSLVVRNPKEIIVLGETYGIAAVHGVPHSEIPAQPERKFRFSHNCDGILQYVEV